MLQLNISVFVCVCACTQKSRTSNKSGAWSTDVTGFRNPAHVSERHTWKCQKKKCYPYDISFSFPSVPCCPVRAFVHACAEMRHSLLNNGLESVLIYFFFPLNSRSAQAYESSRNEQLMLRNVLVCQVQSEDS